jgi:soluble lytic murein transglycosylase-like protein
VKGLQVAGALVAAGTVLVAWTLPRPAVQLAAEPAPAAVAVAPSPSPDPAPPPAPEAAKGKHKQQKPKHASIDKVERMLARKMPGVERAERLRLARAIMEEARFAALDPLFVVAVIAVESGFDRAAESVRGARGLMQLRGPTLEAEAERSKLDGDLEDPVTNVRAGVRYYRRLLAAFGSHDLALMAYNAGPNRILRYLREEGEVPERFHDYPRKVNAELAKLRSGGVPSGRGTVAAAPVPAAPARNEPAVAEPVGPAPAPEPLAEPRVGPPPAALDVVASQP